MPGFPTRTIRETVRPELKSKHSRPDEACKFEGALYKEGYSLMSSRALDMIRGREALIPREFVTKRLHETQMRCSVWTFECKCNAE
jgi:hypothetical protein